MKKLTPFLLVIIVLLSNKEPDSGRTYDLEKAVELKLVEFTIDGRSESPHYAQPAHISLRNLTNAPLNIRIPNGQQLISNPSTVQDLIIVKEEMLILAGGAVKERNLFSMCTQNQNSGPESNTRYSLGKVATGPLKSLTEEIQQRGDFNILGQYSIWAISNERDLSTIAGYDEATADHYQQFVSNLTGRPVPVKDTTDYLTNYNRPNLMTRTIGGKFEYGLSKTSSITIGLFDEQDIIVRELLVSPEVKPGDHKFNFEFDGSAYNDPFYYVRLIIDGDIKLNYKMEIRS